MESFIEAHRFRLCMVGWLPSSSGMGEETGRKAAHIIVPGSREVREEQRKETTFQAMSLSNLRKGPTS